MAKNPRFNNKDMFTNIDSNDYSEITPDNKSEVLATQGNVINSIRVFWNKLKEKLAFAITRADYSKQVGGNYVPIFVNADGVVQECQPTTIQADIENNGIITIPTNTIPNDSIYTGTTVCISFSNNSASGSNSSLSNLQIKHNNSTSPVKYPSGVTVLAKDMSSEGLLLATFCKTSNSNGNNFWILLNKINTVVSTGQTTPDDNVDGGHPGLMTAEDKAKLDTIKWSANNYSLPKADSNVLGGIKLGYTNEGQNYKLQTDGNGNGYVNVPWTDTVYSLPTASKDTLGGVKSSSNTDSDNNNKIYHVGVDTNGIMTVNVPWTDTDTHKTAYLYAGNNTSNDNDVTTNGNTYLKIVDGGSKTSLLKISGTGGTEVKSDDSGNITISSQESFTPVNISSTHYNPTTKYTVPGPGSNKANANYFLAGNGSWVKIISVPTLPSSGDFTLKCKNGVLYWV